MSQPPERLVKAAFGIENLDYPMGLYSAATLGQPEDYTDVVQYSPLINEARAALCGALFCFRGFRFILYVGKDELPMDRFDLPLTQIETWKSSTLRWRLEGIKFTLKHRMSHTVDYVWPPFDRPRLQNPYQRI